MSLPAAVRRSTAGAAVAARPALQPPSSATRAARTTRRRAARMRSSALVPAMVLADWWRQRRRRGRCDGRGEDVGNAALLVACVYAAGERAYLRSAKLALRAVAAHRERDGRVRPDREPCFVWHTIGRGVAHVVQ